MIATVAFVLAIITIAAPARTFAQAPPRIVDISDPQSGGMMSVFAGDTLRVRLLATPGTGYSWQVVQVNKNILVQQSAPTFEAPPGTAVGAEGHSVFDFLAKSTGSCVLQLAYSRPWEKDVAPVRTFSIDVTVQPAKARPMPQF